MAPSAPETGVWLQALSDAGFPVVTVDHVEGSIEKACGEEFDLILLDHDMPGLDATGWLPAASLAIGKAGIRSLALTLHAELAPSGIHAGTITITIAGQIQTGTAFDPARIAQAFWDLHADRPGSFRGELVYRG